MTQMRKQYSKLTGFPHSPDIFHKPSPTISPPPSFSLLHNILRLLPTPNLPPLLGSIILTCLWCPLDFGAGTYAPPTTKTSSVGPTLLLAQAVRLLSVLAARSELQWLTLTGCSTLRDLSYTSSPSCIAKVWLKATLRVVISAQPCVPDMLVEVKSKIKSFKLVDHTDGRGLVANVSHSHPGGEKLVWQTEASPYVSSTPGSLSCRSGRFPWGTKGHLPHRLD
ncbi:hypothetical protein FPSE_05192 [Fusarium pseudograminearum CS3096]|uniref:Uncharacterized protein n=1 Tax=Fusarium pseudograminearum (strain CS3096) TaxID=1028729 RepID=K3VIQ1_FUSPC|nr:hypothetical protein FPSE_05192 [Fusarium pseudograminearum CS3096]EKJ74442.1 hypothetical protein FPSE_05192 [Fusarium pseudograminearum CS3096]